MATQALSHALSHAYIRLAASCFSRHSSFPLHLTAEVLRLSQLARLHTHSPLLILARWQQRPVLASSPAGIAQHYLRSQKRHWYNTAVYRPCLFPKCPCTSCRANLDVPYTSPFLACWQQISLDRPIIVLLLPVSKGPWPLVELANIDVSQMVNIICSILYMIFIHLLPVPDQHKALPETALLERDHRPTEHELQLPSQTLPDVAMGAIRSAVPHHHCRLDQGIDPGRAHYLAVDEVDQPVRPRTQRSKHRGHGCYPGTVNVTRTKGLHNCAVNTRRLCERQEGPVGDHKPVAVSAAYRHTPAAAN